VLGYGVWTAVCFVLFLVFTFPNDVIVRHWTEQLAAESGWRVRFDDVWLRPWNGYHLSNVQVSAPGKGLEPWAAATEVVVRPSVSILWGSGGSPFHFSARFYGGGCAGTIDRAGALDATCEGLRIADYPRITRLVEGVWTGELSGEIHLTGDGDVTKLEGRGKLGLKNAALTQGKAQGFTVPDLHFAAGEADLEMKGGRVEIRTLKLSGSELDVDLRGQLYVRSGAAPPVLNATLNLKPIPGAPPGIEPLLQLLNRSQKPPGGTYAFTLYGPLNALRAR